MATIDGDDDDDELVGTPVADLIRGFGGGDSLYGRGGNDSLFGGDGDDEYRSEAGDDYYDGGAGFDRAWYDEAPVGVTVNLATGRAEDGLGGIDTLVNVERVIGSAFADRLTGSARNDSFTGGAGNDIIAGGLGWDFVWYGRASAGVVVDLLAGTATGGEGADSLSSIEGIGGSNFGDNLYGTNRTDITEWFEPDQTDDQFTPNWQLGGADLIDGRGGRDAVSYDGEPAAVAVNLATGLATDGPGNVDTVINIEDVHGSNYADTLTGNDIANVLVGNGGNDTLAGGIGADTLVGGDGIDSLNGGAGNDRFDLAAEASGVDTLADGTGTDTILSTIARSLAPWAFIENLVLQGNSNINGTGNDGFNGIAGNGGNNTLAGQGGNDALEGLGGDDLLFGQAGQDALVGGAGNDVFGYQTAAHSIAGPTCDYIHDFDDADNDRIDLTGVFGGVLTYMGGAAFTGANQVRVQVVGANIAVAVNLDADIPPEMHILLRNTTLAQMGADDFLL